MSKSLYQPYFYIYRQYIRTSFVHFEIEIEILAIGCYGVFTSTCRDDQMKLLNKLEILLYKKKTTHKSFQFQKTQRQLQATNYLILRTKFQICRTKVVAYGIRIDGRTDGQSDSKVKVLPSRSQRSVVMPPANFNISSTTSKHQQ